MKWIHRDSYKPQCSEEVVVSTEDSRVYRGTYEDQEVYYSKGNVPWHLVIGWMPAKDFPFAKEEDFE